MGMRNGRARERESEGAGEKISLLIFLSPALPLSRSLAPSLPHSPLLSLSEFCLRLFLDPHGLDVDEFADAFARKLAPVARSFHSAEWQSRVGRDHGVDEDQASFDLVYQTVALLSVISPCARGQAEGRGVGQPDRFVEVADSEER